MATKEQIDKAKGLAAMFQMEQSVCLQVLQQMNFNDEDAVDHLLNIKADLNWGKDSGSVNNQNNPPPQKEEDLEYQQQLKELQFEEEERLKKLQEENRLLALQEERIIAEQAKKLQEEEQLRKKLAEEAEELRKKLAEEAEEQRKIERESLEQEAELKAIDEELARKLQEELRKQQSQEDLQKEEEMRLEKELREKERMYYMQLLEEEEKRKQQNSLSEQEKVVQENDEPIPEQPEKAQDNLPKPASISEEKNPLNFSNDNQVKLEDSSTWKIIEDSTLELDMPESPKFTIYHNSFHSTDKTIEEKNEIKKLLLSLGSLESDIKEVDLARDFELAGFIKAKGGGQVPILGVLMRTEIIGDVQLLKQKIESGEILKMLKDDASQIGKLTPQELQLGILDRCLEGAESLFSVLNLLNPLSWLGWNSKIKPTDQVAIEFEVIHTNWYWRCLRRLLRFHGTYFLRIHPKHNDIRAHHDYSNIVSITLVDGTNAVFRYKDGSSPDFIRCTATDLKKMINLISSRCQETKIIQ